MTIKQIRTELKQVRYYYSRRAVFDKALKEVGNKNISDLIKKYNEAVSTAPPQLYDIYIGLYVNFKTQEELSEEMDYSPDYVQKLNNKLVRFFHEKISA